MPPVAPAVAVVDEQALDDEWARELAIALPQQMLDMQLMASGGGFASLSDKWAAQERIEQACAEIARQTAYNVAPEPAAQSVAGMRERLDELQEQCRVRMKERPQD